MRSNSFSLTILALSSFCIQQVFATCAMAQAPATAAFFDPRVTFAPLTLPDPVNAYRSSNGAPGPDYWQNEVDYDLHAQLDAAAKELRATETVTYTNNSPDTLPSLWLLLEQNMYRKDSRARLAGGGRRRRGGEETSAESPSTEGFVFDSVEIEAGNHTTKAEYLVSDTRMQIRLAEPLRGHGGRLKIHIQYHYQIPETWGGRTSWGMSEKGEIYDIAQWYPRMAVYDDFGAGTRCRISGRSSIWSTETSITT
jgi:hypothetical protein